MKWVKKTLKQCGVPVETMHTTHIMDTMYSRLKKGYLNNHSYEEKHMLCNFHEIMCLVPHPTTPPPQPNPTWHMIYYWLEIDFFTLFDVYIKDGR